MFTDKIDPIISNVVATVGGKYLIAKGIGTISWSWTYGEGQIYTNKYKLLFYFTDSQFNILSATALDESIKDYKVTWVPTKGKYSIFT